MKNILSMIAIVIIFIGFWYGALMLAKNLSYKFWYEPMVKQTISDMVKPEALKVK